MNSKIGVLTIATSGTTSTVLPIKNVKAFAIMSPGTLDSGTYLLEGSHDGTTFYGIMSNLASPAALPVPAVNKMIVYTDVCYPFIRLTGPIAAAERTFVVTGSE